MNIKEKIYDLVRESGIRGITIRRIQDRLDPMKIKLSEMRRILSEMSSQEEIIRRESSPSASPRMCQHPAMLISGTHILYF